MNVFTFANDSKMKFLLRIFQLEDIISDLNNQLNDNSKKNVSLNIELEDLAVILFILYSNSNICIIILDINFLFYNLLEKLPKT